MCAIKMQSLLDNFASGDSIDTSLNANEDVIEIKELVSEFTKSLGEPLAKQVKIIESNIDCNIKVDKGLLNDVTRKIFGVIFKIDPKCEVEISTIEDHHDQMIIIFYPSSDEVLSKDFSQAINKPKLESFMEKNGYQFDVMQKDNELSILLYIPSYRVLKKES